MEALSVPSSCRKVARLSFTAMMSVVAFFLALVRTQTEPGSAIGPTVFSGSDAPPGRYPYMVSLRHPSKKEHLCGGFRIEESVVLTAAHCFDSNGGGHHNPMFRIWTGVDQHVDVEAQTIEFHMEWGNDVYEGNDIAVVTLKNPPRDNVWTVRIRPQPGWRDEGAPPELWDRQELTILGWGQTNSFGGSAQALQVAAVQYRRAHRRCERKFSEVDPNAASIVLGETMMCVEPLGGSQTCRGDSGGPLIMQGGTWQEDLAIGILSFGSQDCGDSLPSVFTDLYHYETYLSDYGNWQSPVLRPSGPSASPASPSSQGFPPLFGPAFGNNMEPSTSDKEPLPSTPSSIKEELEPPVVLGPLQPSGAPPSSDFAALLLESGFQPNPPVEVDPPFKYPFVVNIARFDLVSYCMGTLISPTVVITAAHCDKDLYSMHVWIGRHNLYDRSELDKDLQSFEIIEKAFPDVPYNPKDSSNDIMLLKLDREVDVDNFPPIAGIDDGSFASAMEKTVLEALVVGHGSDESRNDIPHMRQAHMRGVPLPLCNGNDVYGGKVTETMMCASNLDVDLCGGSSGAPLMVYLPGGYPVMVGFTSWGITCDTKAYPTVFTRIGSYRGWIAKTLANWGSQKIKVWPPDAPGPLQPSGAPPSSDFAALLLESGFQPNSPVEVDPPFKYPFVVNIARFDLLAYCMGTLISPTVVITAAQCDKDPYNVWIGRHNRDDRSEWDKDLQSFAIIGKAFPDVPNNSSTDLSNDIMLLKLDREVDVDKFPPIAGIDDGSFATAMEQTSLEALVVGHGSDESRNDIPHMRQAHMRGVPLSLCNSNDVYGGRVTGTMMCASSLDVGLCLGSSGAPLMIYLPGGYPVMVGFTSWGITCDTKAYPAVFTRIGAYRGWIAEKLADWGSHPAQIWPPTTASEGR